MVIGGFQKVSLVDFPGRIASIVFTQGCMFRCPYCHNPELIATTRDSRVSEEQVFSYLEERKQFIEGVCITGGEPTLQADLPRFIGQLKSEGFAVKLDTNGTNPRMVQGLLEQKLLDYVAMDLKHTWEKYDEVARIKNPTALANCRETFRLIQRSGVEHEFRTTILPGVHQPDDFHVIAGYLESGERYFIQKTAFQKILDPTIGRDVGFEADTLAEDLRRAFPQLLIGVR